MKIMANTPISAEIIAKARERAKNTGENLDVALANLFGDLLFEVDIILHYFEPNVAEDLMGSLEFQDVFLGYVERFLNKKEF